jgi:Flp pilus assembly protein TadD, contains TPR repeats
MKRLSIFLSAAMTGELGSERDGVRILFGTDAVLKEFFELYAIEEHASPQPIEKAYIDEVRHADLLILLLDEQLRDAVEKEFLEACNLNLRIFVYIRNTGKRDERLVEFIGQQAYRFHCGSFNDTMDLCSKIRNDILSDLTRKYSETINVEKLEQDYVAVSSTREYFGSSLRYYDHNLLVRISESDTFRGIDADQLIVLATLKAEETGNLKEALLIYEIILLRDPYNWQAYNNRGLILYEMGLVDDALVSYRKALELNAESDATLYNIGIYYRDKNRYDEAIEYYQQALSIKPDKASALGHLVGIYVSKKEYKKALEYAEKAYSLEKDNINLSNLCIALTLAGIKLDALTKTEGLKGTKYHEKIRAYIFYSTEEWGSCMSEIDKFFQLWGFDYDLSIKRVYCLIHANDIKGAIAWLTELEEKHYLYPSDYNNIAWTLYEKKLEPKYAARLFRKAVDGDPTILAAWKNLQCVLAELKEVEEGLQVSDRALNYFPDDTGMIMNRTKFLFLSGDIRQAASYAIRELTRLFGQEMPPTEIEEMINQSFANAGIRNIESLETIVKALVQLERSKTQKQTNV